MKILYLADPNSLHDTRWINFFAEYGIGCYLIVRKRHELNSEYPFLDERVRMVGTIRDPSTIRPFQVIVQLVRIKAIIRKYEIDLFHILYAEPNALWANARSFLGLPIVLTTRGTDVLRTIPMFFQKKSVFSKAVAWQYRRAFRKVDAITSTSQTQADRVQLFNTAKPVVIVRTGVDFQLIDRVRADGVNVPEIDRPFILMPRKMEPLYDHEFTLEAIELLPDPIRNTFVFVFVNSDTAQQSYYRKVVNKANGISAVFRFLPTLSQKDLISLYKCASLVIMNPRSDGSPVSAMEAMACRVPVILPPLSYDSDLFDRRLSFGEWDPLALKKVVEKALLMPEGERRELLDNQYRRVRQGGDIGLQMRKVLQIYNDLCRED